jgi:hypothetical protein
MNENWKPSRVTLLWIMAFLVSLSIFLSWKFTADHWRVELVKRGHARWVVMNEKGSVQWEWVTPVKVGK